MMSETSLLEQCQCIDRKLKINALMQDCKCKNICHCDVATELGLRGHSQCFKWGGRDI